MRSLQVSHLLFLTSPFLTFCFLPYLSCPVPSAGRTRELCMGVTPFSAVVRPARGSEYWGEAATAAARPAASSEIDVGT